MTRYSRDIQRLTNRRSLVRARDGAIIDPVVDEVNGIQWFFQFKKSALTKYKWYAIGQQEPLLAVDAGTYTIPTINTWSAPGNSVIVPFSGEYSPRVFAQPFSISALTTFNIACAIDGVFPPTDILTRIYASGAVDSFEGEDPNRKEILAGHAAQLAFNSTVVHNISSRVLKVRPIRILV